MWETESGRELLNLKGHTDSVRCVAFSPDGRRLASASWDGTVIVREAATHEDVSRWRREEFEAEERWTRHNREYEEAERRQATVRLTDEGAIKQWLILAPLPLGRGRTPAQELATEQIPNEGQLHPRTGELVRANATELAWREGRFDDGVIDFVKFLGSPRTFVAGYAVAYVTAETNLHHLLLKVGSDDEARVYLNGREVYEISLGRRFLQDQDTVAEIDLKRGINTVVFKVLNQEAAWSGSVRFTDAAGNPLKGIKVGLTPPQTALKTR